MYRQQYVLDTNMFAQGVGGREQQLHLWFDPTKEFQTNSILSCGTPTTSCN